MMESIKEALKKIQDDPPGKRFIRQYRRRQLERGSILRKTLFISAGTLIVLAGIFFLPAPGPGMLIIFIGLGLISQESRWMALMLDKLELKVRVLVRWTQKWWNTTSVATKVLLGFVILLVAVTVVYGACLLIF